DSGQQRHIPACEPDRDRSPAVAPSPEAVQRAHRVISEIRNLPGHVFLPGALALPSCLRSIRARDFGARAPVPAPIPCRHGPSPSIPGGDLRGTPDRGPPRPGFVLRSRRAAERRRQTVAAAVPGADAVVVPLFAL